MLLREQVEFFIKLPIFLAVAFSCAVIRWMPFIMFVAIGLHVLGFPKTDAIIASSLFAAAAFALFVFHGQTEGDEP